MQPRLRKMLEEVGRGQVKEREMTGKDIWMTGTN